MSTNRKGRSARILLMTALLALGMALLAGCGGGAGKGDTFDLGSAKVTYQGYEITQDETGNDAIVITYEYTNNEEAANSMLYAVLETPYQDEMELSTAVVWTDKESLEAVGDSATQEVGPGETIEVKTAHILQDSSTPVRVELESLSGGDTAEFTIDI